MSETKRQNKNYFLAVITSLAIFCMGQITGSIDAVIEEISSAFHLSSTTGMYVTTVACIVSVVFSIFLGFVAGKKIGYRPLVLFCAVVELVSALLPVFTGNFITLLILRGLFGVGLGGMQSMQNTVATILIPVEKRASILGIGMSVGFAMNCILQLLGGVLAEFGWNYAFLNHLLLFIPFAVIVIGCLKMDFTPADREAEPEQAGSIKQSQDTTKLGLPVWQCWIMMLLLGVLIAPLLVGCSFLSEAIIDSTTVAGVVAVFFSVGCIIGGLIYPKLFGVLGKKSFFCFLAMTAVGLFGCGVSRSVVLLCLFIFIAGLGLSLTLTCANMTLGLVTSAARIAFVSAFMMALYNLGIFLSSSYENIVGRITGDTLYMPLYISGIVVLALAVIYAVVSPLRRCDLSGQIHAKNSNEEGQQHTAL